jgi:mono/diheme cytochrome c family protein
MKSQRTHKKSLFEGTCRKLFFLTVILLVSAVVYFISRFGVDSAVSYNNIGDHFKYGSTGGERESGFPYWVFKVLPKVCAKHLPGDGYQSIGFLFEEGKDLPVGISKRRVTGIDRVFVNCAVCHTSTYRETPESQHQLVLGMPANRFNFRDFQNFFFNCASDPNFKASYIVPTIEKEAGKLGLLDKYVVYPIAINIMRERLIELKAQFEYVNGQPVWGPGRVDTFNAAKAIFNFPMQKASAAELVGTADFPSIWNQQKRQGMQLHWDGNNTQVEERNKSAAFGTGTTPPTIDLDAIKRVEDWLSTLTPPPYPFAINSELAAKGEPVYKEYCADCHGADGRNFEGKYIGTVVPINEIGTDRWRLDSYTYELSVNQSTLYAGYPWRFTHFRKTFGYANMPLDGLWLRGPYLHNGSVPTIRDLLEPGERRPKTFYRGFDVIDQKKLGYVYDIAAESSDTFFLFDTRLPGNGNYGHEGKKYGTQLPPEQKESLVEYLKTF